MPRKPAADSLARALDRAEAVLARLEALLPVPPAEPDWRAHGFRWRKRGERGFLQAVPHPQAIRRSEERRVGKEGGSQWAAEDEQRDDRSKHSYAGDRAEE